MRRLMITGVETLKFEDMPCPTPDATEAVVAVRSCGVCGTDLSFLKHGGLQPGTPIAIGHEIAGVVVSVGRSVASLDVGDRVVVNGSAPNNGIGSGGSEGGFSEFVLLRDVDRGDVAYSLPSGIDFDLAALVEPIAVGQRAVNRSGAGPSSKVCIFGAGPIGLGALIALRDRGVENIVVVDGSAYRRALAVAFGARAVADPAADLHEVLAREHGDGRFIGRIAVGTDIFIDAAGAPAVFGEVVRLCRRDARLVLVAVYSGDSRISWRDVLAKELSIVASMGHPVEFPDVLDLVARWGERLRPLITHRFPFEQVEEAIATAGQAGSAGKVMVFMSS